MLIKAAPFDFGTFNIPCPNLGNLEHLVNNLVLKLIKINSKLKIKFMYVPNSKKKHNNCSNIYN
jgi:hypothetical protein